MNSDPDTEETIFSAAFPMKATGQRAAYLDHACAGNTDLRRRVEELLRAGEAAGTFLESPPERPRLFHAAGTFRNLMKHFFPNPGPGKRRELIAGEESSSPAGEPTP